MSASDLVFGDVAFDLGAVLRRAAPVGELGFECGDLARDAPRLLVERLAVGGEMEGPRRALQEPHAQPAFQPGDELAEGRILIGRWLVAETYVGEATLSIGALIRDHLLGELPARAQQDVRIERRPL